MRFKEWLPFILQSIVILGAAWTYTSQMEHRVSVLETNIAAQARTQELIQQQLHDQQITLLKLVTLEEWLHGRTVGDAK